MRRHAPTGRRGFTLLEVMVVCGIFAALLVGVSTFSLRTHDGYEAVLQGAQVTMNLRRPLEAVAGELRNSTPSRVVVDDTDPSHDRVTLQVPVGYNAGSIVWGADGVAGRQIEYTVSAGELWRRVLEPDLTPVDARRVARHVDVLREGEKGFRVEADGPMCTLTLRARMARDGRRIERQATTSVVLKNPN